MSEKRKDIEEIEPIPKEHFEAVIKVVNDVLYEIGEKAKEDNSEFDFNHLEGANEVWKELVKLNPDHHARKDGETVEVTVTDEGFYRNEDGNWVEGPPELLSKIRRKNIDIELN